MDAAGLAFTTLVADPKTQAKGGDIHLTLPCLGCQHERAEAIKLQLGTIYCLLEAGQLAQLPSRLDDLLA